MCHRCKTIVQTRSREVHYWSHFPERLRCPVRTCEQIINGRHSLVRHLRIHDVSERAKCPACPLLASLTLLRIHVQMDHFDVYSDDPQLFAFKHYVEKSVRCPVRSCAYAHKACEDPLEALKRHGEGVMTRKEILRVNISPFANRRTAVDVPKNAGF